MAFSLVSRLCAIEGLGSSSLDNETLREAYLEVGSRTDSRDTFFCVAKRKYPKKRPPHAAWILRSEGFERVLRRGWEAPSENPRQKREAQDKSAGQPICMR